MTRRCKQSRAGAARYRRRLTINASGGNVASCFAFPRVLALFTLMMAAHAGCGGTPATSNIHGVESNEQPVLFNPASDPLSDAEIAAAIREFDGELIRNAVDIVNKAARLSTVLHIRSGTKVLSRSRDSSSPYTDPIETIVVRVHHEYYPDKNYPLGPLSYVREGACRLAPRHAWTRCTLTEARDEIQSELHAPLQSVFGALGGGGQAIFDQLASRFARLQDGPQGLASLDPRSILRCKKNTGRFRQYCDLGEGVAHSDMMLPQYAKTYWDDVVELLRHPTDLGTPISGLAPALELEIDWTDSRECWRDGTVNQKMMVVVGKDNLGTIRTGRGANSYPLGSALHVDRWRENGPMVTARANFSFADGMGDTPNASRWPSNCDVRLMSASVSYDKRAILADLARVDAEAGDKERIVEQAVALHGFFVNPASDPVCRVVYLLNTLKRVESFARQRKVELADLTRISRGALEEAVRDAVEREAIPRADVYDAETGGDNYWAFLTRRAAALEADTRCVAGSEGALPDDEIFVARGLGNMSRERRNASAYLEAKQRLLRLRTIRTALVLVSHDAILQNKTTGDTEVVIP